MQSTFDILVSSTPGWILAELRKLTKNQSDFHSLLEDFNERAAIMEYDGNMDRPTAELRALTLIKQQTLKSTATSKPTENKIEV